MARKPTARELYAIFNVTYEDGSLRSNRKVSGSEFKGPEGEAEARALIAQQDRDIAERSGIPAMTIKTLARVRR